MKPINCPVCGADALKKRTGTETFEYKGESTTIPDYVTYECKECGESIVDNKSLKESGKKLKDFQRQVDGLLTGQQIKKIRLKLDLTQEEFAGIIGGGRKSVTRYETGQICQSKGMDNLLRILDAYPETINVIKKNKDIVKGFAQIIYLDDAKKKSAYKLDIKKFSYKIEETAYGS
ncbi:type II toxin-antitoxin system MqsA family antitoxin [Desulfobacterium sp. N47]|uniref:HTH cro/C1-type domain-containing protein n=1 Tax=uncultured Desulfobacterium sp. TaxID=201089 RepID=E1YKP7_9BACT|nr:hypothetical protein N47_E41920 [uncultured Desulfobacterium sp.]